MPFIVNDSVDQVKLLNGGVVGVTNDRIEKKVKVDESRIASIQIMEGGNAIDIRNFLLHTLQ